MTYQSLNDQLQASSFMQGQNAECLEKLYVPYANDPNKVDKDVLEVFG